MIDQEPEIEVNDESQTNARNTTAIIAGLMDHTLTYVRVGKKHFLVNQEPSPTREDVLRRKRFESAFVRQF